MPAPTDLALKVLWGKMRYNLGFGRKRGENTLGIILGMNDTRASTDDGPPIWQMFARFNQNLFATQTVEPRRITARPISDHTVEKVGDRFRR